MKLSIAAVSSFIAAAVAASLPESFTLVADGGKTVLTDGSNAFIGGSTDDKKILVLRGGSGGSQVTYTADDQTPTGWQNLYAITNANKPIALTVPHSGATPEGANINGWGVNDDGYFTFNGKQAFAVQSDDGAQKIYYLGAGEGQFQKTPLYVKKY
ncbi:uncharacterized protein ACHE_70021A [Aspergillus chevalieri]|uniref:Uncharacterized protein n=1 Tax=Aspergillus chevalieri TaxID=182096 RepID=A0A7R7VVV6_ASPCH|nr:uncharacterized protein ACHE_70021A [Aspergillus chevalieri]BCR91178.1 hypothetical protein ACHE_70021A [Aspergillus chevalieri]